MKKLGLVLFLAAFCLAPVAADAQAVYYGPSSQPYVMYLAPQVIYAPPVMIQLPPTVVVQAPPEPPKVVQPPAPLVPVLARGANRVETRVEAAGGIQVNTTCAHCSVTNNVYADGAKVVKPTKVVKPMNGANGNGNNAKVKLTPSSGPSSSAAKLWWDDPDSLWILLIAAAIAILVLLAILCGRKLLGGQCPVQPNPAPEPVRPAPAAAPAAPRRPRQRVHTKKCQHDDCPHTVTICCHAGDNDSDGQAG